MSADYVHRMCSELWTIVGDGHLPGVVSRSRTSTSYVVFVLHGRHLFNLQYLHSRMNQCGPEWQALQFQERMLVSDLIVIHECVQLAGMVNCEVRKRRLWWKDASLRGTQ